MPTTCWADARRRGGVAVLAVAGLAGLAGPARASGGEAPLSVEGTLAAPGKTALVVKGAGAPLRIVVARGNGVPAGAPPDAVQVLGRVGDGALLVLETYPSRLNGGAGACGAGEERIVRALRLAPAPAAGTWQLRVASCWQSLEPDAAAPGQGLEWNPASATLVVRWISGPGTVPGSKAYRVAPDGRVKEVKPPA